MSYEYITRHNSPNYTRGRPVKINGIVIHHWGVTGQKFDNVVNYLCRSGGNSSAHYVVEGGRVACIVAPANTAWHAGVLAVNQRTIGIECRPEATDADYRTVAELVAELRAAYGPLPLSKHSDYKATSCPGVWDLARINRLASGDAGSAEPPPPTPAPAPDLGLVDVAARLPVLDLRNATAKPVAGMGVDVLQGLLMAHGQGPDGLTGRSGRPDGSAGDGTKTALLAYQRAHGLDGDAVAGAATWASLLTP